MDLIKELVKRGVLSKEKGISLEYETQSSNKKDEEILIGRDIIDEDRLFKIKSEITGLPLRKVYAEDVPLDILKLMPAKLAEEYKMIPIGLEQDTLLVGMVYPRDMEAQEALKFATRQSHLKYKIFLITTSTYNDVFKKYRGLKKVVASALQEIETPEKKREKKKKEWKRLVEETPISKVVDVLLKHALEGSASDIHIEPFGEKLRVRFRVLGKLHSSIFLPLDYLPSIVTRIKILAELRIDENRIPQDGRFSKEIENRKIDFRVSTLPTGNGEKVAIRVLDPRRGSKSFDKLGLSERNFQLLHSGTKQGGMILVSGPTGSGKTTTLYSVLRYLNKESVNIVTLEDPIEYFIEGINQSQIEPGLGYDFAEGLRYVVRQDPDIIMIGEIRDAKSAQLSIHAGLTGHLVLSTLHATNVFGIIPRLSRLTVEPYLIPIVLKVIASQRLIRRLCDKCKKKVKPSPEIRKIIAEELSEVPKSALKDIKIPSPLYTWEAVGCKECNHTGFSDRIGVFEVLGMTDSLAKIILDRELEEERLRKEADKQGMITMRQDAIIKAITGITTIEEALTVVKANTK